MSSTPNYVIVDTDAGVDDSLALMLAFDCHKRGLIDILAITCVYGNVNVDKVIKNVLLIQRICGIEGLKVYKGADHPLVSSTGFEDGFFGTDGLGGATQNMDDIEVNIEEENAVVAMARLAREYPKQISMVTLGPLTNLALANQIDNTFFDNMSRIVAMGGLLDTMGNVGPTTEFNFYNDPDSVHVVLTKSKCPFTLVPWDTAVKTRIPWDKYSQLNGLNTDKTDFIEKIYGWYRDDPLYGKNQLDGLVLCDICCVISAVFPDLILKSSEFPVAMELTGRLTRGQLVVGRTRLIFPFSGSRKIVFVEELDVNKVIDLIVEMCLR